MDRSFCSWVIRSRLRASAVMDLVHVRVSSTLGMSALVPAIMEGGTMNAAAAFNAPLLVARSTLLLRGMNSHLGREGSAHSPRFPASNSGFRSLPFLPLRINPAPHKSTRRRLYCSISSHVSGLRKWRLPRSTPSLSIALRTDRTLSKWTRTAAVAGQYQIDGQRTDLAEIFTICGSPLLSILQTLFG